VGSVLRVCVGDRELDGMDLCSGAFDLPLGEELVVDRAGLVAMEAVFVRVIEPLQ
jgi:hypothetical protein